MRQKNITDINKFLALAQLKIHFEGMLEDGCRNPAPAVIRIYWLPS